MQSTSGSTTITLLNNKEEINGEEQITKTGQGVSDIDLDWYNNTNKKYFYLKMYFLVNLRVFYF